MDKNELAVALISYAISGERGMVEEVNARYLKWIKEASIEERNALILDIATFYLKSESNPFDLMLALTPPLFCEVEEVVIRNTTMLIAMFGSRGQASAGAMRDYLLYLCAVLDSLKGKRWMIFSQLSNFIDAASYDQYFKIAHTFSQEELELVVRDLHQAVMNSNNLYQHQLLSLLDNSYRMPEQEALQGQLAQFGARGELVMIPQD